MELDDEYVKSILIEFLYFPGWKLDLDISPISVYNTYWKDYRVYRYSIETLSSVIDSDDLKRSFYICQRYDKIRKEIENYIK
jgi:hypothetical protein